MQMKKITLIAFILLSVIHCYTQEINQLESFPFSGKYKPDIMILGVYHFANPGLDAHKSPDIDMLTEQKQKEIDILLDKIQKFKPTKILIEESRGEMDSIIDNRYNRYLDGSFNIDDKSDEIYQIGFKLAKRLNHKKVYCSDSYVGWCGTKDIDWDTFGDEEKKEYLTSKNQYEKVNRYDYELFNRYEDSLEMILPLTSYLEIINRPSVTKKYHQVYLTSTILCGAGDNYYGSDSVSRWYRRNLRIFSNIYDIISFDTQEKILIIYGAGHVWLLRQFIKDSPDFNYVEVNDYLR